MARHAASNNQRRALLRVGLTVAAAGAAAIGAGGAAAQAAPVLPLGAPLASGQSADDLLVPAGVEHALPGALAPVKSLQLDPLANSGVDPLDNAVGTQIADFKPVSTAMVTDPVTRGGALQDLPLVGQATALLPG
ncbi:hypothetical protein ACFYWY_36040 [Streptomyces sp. NPDC002870]|uniref:hypothetical protein n=1 Tax=Streptomyces sp. NPDC002870 TaxID=3364666 RepID=UPI00367DE2EC